MHTCSSPPQSVSGDTTAVSTGKSQADWSDDNKKELINFLLDCKAEAGYSATFKPVVWNAAARHMEQFWKKGGPKTAGSCSSKWSQVHATASDVDYPLMTVLAQGDLYPHFHTEKIHIWF